MLKIIIHFLWCNKQEEHLLQCLVKEITVHKTVIKIILNKIMNLINKIHLKIVTKVQMINQIHKLQLKMDKHLVVCQDKVIKIQTVLNKVCLVKMNKTVINQVKWIKILHQIYLYQHYKSWLLVWVF